MGDMYGGRGRLSSALGEGGNGDSRETVRRGAHRKRSWQRVRSFGDVGWQRVWDCGVGAQGGKDGGVMRRSPGK